MCSNVLLTNGKADSNVKPYRRLILVWKLISGSDKQHTATCTAIRKRIINLKVTHLSLKMKTVFQGENRLLRQELKFAQSHRLIHHSRWKLSFRARTVSQDENSSGLWYYASQEPLTQQICCRQDRRLGRAPTWTCSETQWDKLPDSPSLKCSLIPPSHPK